MNNFEWEGAVTEAVTGLLIISKSHAAGIVEAQPSCMQQPWGKGMDPQQTAIKILAAAHAE